MTTGELESTPVRENSAWLHRHRWMIDQSWLTIDIGCGLGHDSLELARLGCRVVALDRSLERLKQIPLVSGIELRIEADLRCGLPFRNEQFDLAVASLSLHYFGAKETKAVMRDVSRVLRQESPFLLRVNARGDHNFGFGSGIEVEPGVWRQPEGHLKRFFTSDDLITALEPDFDIIEITRRAILQDGRLKRTIECVAQKSG